MAARLWTALLMLAAVFAMHGVQCAGAADSATSAATTVHVVTPAHSGSSAMTALAPGQALPAVGAARADDATSAHTTVAAAAVPVGAGHGSAPHDWAAHLWTACLAVLAAALAVLLALLVPRLVRLGPPALRSPSARASGWLVPPRPPDLSALCLLRI
ncbi:DUF6153 family protein [Modestobacter excelsi]|uniref:DUF6153 family protein n=1 Tax=Modestobacter excelsi TaxID=2213161 RepID=UPI00110C91FE|nr:DUF6153 family protein [Modestobacter excelsi]